MAAKRQASVTKAVRLRDGWICQCCGGIGDEVHHIHPICFGGKDDESNCILLCSPCHKHAPDDPNDFSAYQRQGGYIFRECTRQTKGDFSAFMLRKSILEKAPPPSDSEIKSQFKESLLASRLHFFANPSRLLGAPSFDSDYWAPRAPDENEQDFALAASKASKWIEFFEQFPESEYAEEKRSALEWLLRDLEEMRKRYGVSADELYAREVARAYLTEPAESLYLSGHRFASRREDIDFCLRRLSEKHSFLVEISRALSSNPVSLQVVRDVFHKAEPGLDELGSNLAVIAAMFMLSAVDVVRCRLALATHVRKMMEMGASLYGLSWAGSAAIQSLAGSRYKPKLLGDEPSEISERIWVWARTRLGLTPHPDSEVQLELAL